MGTRPLEAQRWTGVAISTCRSIVTICSGLYLLIGMTCFSSKWILSHSTWYKKRRSRHFFRPRNKKPPDESNCRRESEARSRLAAESQSGCAAHPRTQGPVSVAAASPVMMYVRDKRRIVAADEIRNRVEGSVDAAKHCRPIGRDHGKRPDTWRQAETR
jgi:hypothetical protein